MASSSDPGSGTGLPYRFAVDGFDTDHFRVHAFTGREALSEHYRFDVIASAVSDTDDEVERLALGRRAVLTWNVSGTERTFHGVVAAVRLEEVHETPHTVQYRVRFVPRLWLLRRRRRSRIFQKQSLPDVVETVLREAGVPTRWQLTGTYPSHDYVTQLEESDYRFVTRLLAEAGICFYFAQGPEPAAAATDGPVPGETVVFGDDVTAYSPLGGDDPAAVAAVGGGDAPDLHFMPMENTSTGHLDKITRFTARTTVRATQAAFRAYDPDRPRGSPGSAATSTLPFTDDTPAGASPSWALPAAAFALEAYEHHGPFLFPDWTETAAEAARILRQKRRRAFTATGESGCPYLAPGHRFTLQDHPASRLDAAYVVTSVEHRGEARPQQGSEWRIYACSFECAPAVVTYVPPRPRRRSKQVMLTATVVGPPGEDIYVDATGQIKVQFHWDRDGGSDDRSSCWIRTMHAWGGTGWGVQLIPRVGMEVMVTFEGGDPDKPLVLGSVYNGTHPTPFQLPGDRTRSGIRTQSSPGGGGSNELSFEDQAGSEQIYLHAQRDLDLVVERNHTRLVQGDERLRVLGSRMNIVEEDVITRVAHHVEEHVGADRTSYVDGNRIGVVTGNADARVSGTLTTRIDGRERRDVQHDATLAYGQDLTTRVRGCLTTVVGKDSARRSWVTHAEGNAKLSSLDSTQVASEGELLLTVGKGSIRITADKIEIDAPAITVKGAAGGLSAADDGLTMTSKKDVQIQVEKKLTLKTSDGAALSMEKEIKADGKAILLNAPDDAQDKPPPPPAPPTTIALTDQDAGKPLPYQRYLIVLDDGSEVSGMTDKDGKAELDLKSAGKITFPDVTMPGDQSNKGDMRPYVVRQGDYLTKLAFAQGFDVDEVWGDPKNAELKNLRQDHHTLAPGDVVQIPAKLKEGLPVQKGASNPYTAKVPTVEVKLCLRKGTRVLRNEPYTVQGLEGDWSSTKTDGDGKLTLQVPVTVREILLIATKTKVRYKIHIGDLDPITTESGLIQRLSNLGYYRVREGVVPAEDALAKALRKLQHKLGIEVNGVADAATLDAMRRDHGH